MITPKRRLKITTQVEFVVPVDPGLGCPYQDLADALNHVAEQWAADFPGQTRAKWHGDTVTVHLGDDEIILRYAAPDPKEEDR